MQAQRLFRQLGTEQGACCAAAFIGCAIQPNPHAGAAAKVYGIWFQP